MKGQLVQVRGGEPWKVRARTTKSASAAKAQRVPNWTNNRARSSIDYERVDMLSEDSRRTSERRHTGFKGDAALQDLDLRTTGGLVLRQTHIGLKMDHA